MQTIYQVIYLISNLYNKTTLAVNWIIKRWLGAKM